MEVGMKKEKQEWFKWRLAAIYLGMFVGFVLFGISKIQHDTGDFFDMGSYYHSFKLSFMVIAACTVPFVFGYLHLGNIEKGAVMKSMLLYVGIWIGVRIVYVIF
jgi:hypothetical protein